MRVRRSAIVVLLLAMVIAGCSDNGPDIKTVTCAEWSDLSESDVLDVSLGLMKDSKLAPSGDHDSAKFAEYIDASCAAPGASRQKVYARRVRIAASFLSDYPEAAGQE